MSQISMILYWLLTYPHLAYKDREIICKTIQSILYQSLIKMQTSLSRLTLHCCIKWCILQWSIFVDTFVLQIMNDAIVCYGFSLNDKLAGFEASLSISVYFCFCLQNADETRWASLFQMPPTNKQKENPTYPWYLYLRFLCCLKTKWQIFNFVLFIYFCFILLLFYFP